MSSNLALHEQSSLRGGLTALYAFAVVAVAGWLAYGVSSAPGTRIDLLALAPVLMAMALAILVAASVHRSLGVARRLSLCRDFGILFGPGQDFRSSLHGFARTLRACLGADECIIVLDPAHSQAPGLYIDDGSSAGPGRLRSLDSRLADALLALPPERAVIFARPRLPGARAGCRAFDCGTLEPRPAPSEKISALANLLEATSFVSLPLRSRTQTLGRVHVISRRRRYGAGAMRLLAQLTAQAAPLIENVQLVEKLALGVATQERRRISRDLHDGTVQPYIGLKLGLEALRRRLSADAPAAREVDELVRMAGDGISQLRDYVGTLSQPGTGRAKHVPLVQGVREQVRRFSEFHKIDGSVLAEAELDVPAPLYDELIHVVREGLSNIRRHTLAARARVSVRSSPGMIIIEIANDSPPDTPAFHPRSIAERVHELGGVVAISIRPPGETVVAVEIPFK